MSEELTKAQADHQNLLELVTAQLDHGDPAPVERFALLAVQMLLRDHEPTDLTGDLNCEMCIEQDCGEAVEMRWPCATYYVIKKAAEYGK